ncbi:hypothetical protein MI1_09346 (plasmid) [Leuconostoc mesenteroides subsp. mesenteroides J18]|uniref:MBL fold metallo-hydrolase n=1 Tax=Leuconostoc mesenteroides TaxID=1245 RepID=UPI00023408EE|nr:MBL fold metallo-hydrolase [Leuconostoc mesenteroides]AET31276.1 hypothetical protein MI1_09346 [Leuconostoc mesenteroides subsp. mesenteroides J18]AQU50269.1 hypothetical protein ARA01_09500 [Leuconostoc mesenteroides subsp. mesenteroides]AQU50311.1 hypothetical protein ARA01_09715 [Leuconostoc mesenteroides subsp. mesenteroides]
MKIQQIRNATVKIEYSDQTFLVDPMLSKKETLAPFPSKDGNTNKNPLVDLTESISSILEGITAVIVTHNHVDHWDSRAMEVINKNTPIFVQDRGDQISIANSGFNDVRILGITEKLGDVIIKKITGQHYENDAVKQLLDNHTDTSHTMGFFLESVNEKSILFTGDTIWFEGLKSNLEKLEPGVVVMNSGGNGVESGRLILDAQDVVEIHKTLPKTLLIASHMEAVNHWTTSKSELLSVAKENDFADSLIIPNDGERLVL